MSQKWKTFVNYVDIVVTLVPWVLYFFRVFLTNLNLKWMELCCQVLLGHFGPVYLCQVSKYDDEEHCC